MGEETRFGVACLVAVALEGGVDEVVVVDKEGGGGDAFIASVGLGETVVGGTTEVVIQDEGNAGEASEEGEVSELDKLRVGLLVLMVKVGEVVSASCCWLLDIDTGEGVSNWVVSCT